MSLGQHEIPFDDSEFQLELADDTGAVFEDDDELDNDDPLGDLSSVADSLFRVWFAGGDRRWADFAWSVLSRAGLATWDNESQRAEAVIRLAALASIYRQFYVFAFDEGEYGDWRYELFDLVGEYPLIHPFTLGRLAEREDFDDFDEKYCHSLKHC